MTSKNKKRVQNNIVIGSPIVIANFALEQIVRAEGASTVSMNGMGLSVIVNMPGSCIINPIVTDEISLIFLWDREEAIETMLFIGGSILGQTEARFEKEVKKSLSIKYLFYLPKDYKDNGMPWPLILFLHGAGECGNDLEVVKRNGIPKIVEEVTDFPFIAISPQCPEGTWWGDHVETLIMLLDDINEKYNVDKNRVYLTGLSMGGYGTWLLSAINPDRFAAIAPICGGGDPEWAKILKNLPIWVFHGEKDDIVPITESKKMVTTLKDCGNNVKFTVYSGVGHDSWVKAYEDPELYQWFLSKDNNQF